MVFSINQKQGKEGVRALINHVHAVCHQCQRPCDQRAINGH